MRSAFPMTMSCMPSYDADAAQRFWRALVQADRVFKLFRTAFLGKASPVHFFWGSFDLAVTRFSGRRAPLHPGGVPRPAGRGDARSLFARSEQRRLLARQRRVSAGRVLFVRVSARLPGSPTPGFNPRARRGRRRWANGCCRTTRAHGGGSRRHLDAIPRDDVSRSRQACCVGSVARMQCRRPATPAARGNAMTRRMPVRETINAFMAERHAMSPLMSQLRMPGAVA